ncbi:MAG TPA: hypothetical protein VNO50_18095 [Pyrinomonadaceae bacterium]|nr:hypothetical protein [Pyrinomonadaceae bacterium]
MKPSLSRFVIALVIFVLFGGLPASAGRIGMQIEICIEKVVDLEPERSWIPVGCEVIDCCPACPGPPIDWRIRVQGELLESVVLTFDNLPTELTKSLDIKGDAKWEGNSLRVGQGETLISGFNGDSRDVPPVATPRLLVNKERVKRLAESAAGDADKSGGKRDAGKIEVTIEQMRGKYLVNETSLVYTIILCPRPRLETDKIDLSNNTTNDNTVVLLDARNGSGVCVDDEIERGVDIINLGSILTNSTCNSEVAVFSDDNAMKLVTPVNSWTDPVTDTLPVNLDPILDAPVSVWLVTPALARAEGDLANANLLYNSNNVGISFNPTFQDVSGNATAINAITSQGTTLDIICGNGNNIQASAFFTPNRLNVYYVNSAFTGGNCVSFRNIIFIGTTANNQSLAHEIGHSFSLSPSASGGHTNGLAGFDGTNIMQGGGAGRTHFSEGQAFRMNVNATSTLNVNGVRTGTTRTCAPLTTSNICPRLALNATPK